MISVLFLAIHFSIDERSINKDYVLGIVFFRSICNGSSDCYPNLYSHQTCIMCNVVCLRTFSRLFKRYVGVGRYKMYKSTCRLCDMNGIYQRAKEQHRSVIDKLM